MTENKAVALRWLQERPAVPAGITWGVPWLEGALKRDETIVMNDSEGRSVPLQSWPTAFWPDGSVKWSAHAAALPASSKQASPSKGGEGFTIAVGKKGAEPWKGVTIRESEAFIEVDTGRIVCRLNRQGAALIDTIFLGDKQVCSGAELVCIREEHMQSPGSHIRKEELFQSAIDKAVIEQRGPVRAVIRIEGRHRSRAGGSQWLPFHLRLYFYAGLDSIKAVHTFHYNGNQHQDFIKGIGISFQVPMRGALYNRHVRLAGDTGMFTDSPKLLMTHRTKGKYEALYREQIAGRQIAFDETEDAHFLGLLDDSAVWNDFKLVQQTADSYRVTKRTKEGCSWVKGAEGTRAGGLLYAGSEGGGLAVGLRNFWEKYPSSLAIEHMAGDQAALTAWFWSPDAEAMDLRHYDTETHVQSAYEGFDEMRSTPFGIANTSELTIWCMDETPSHEMLQAFVRESQTPDLLVCEPGHYHRTAAFGTWSLPDRSHPTGAYLEEQLDQAIQCYKDEIEQRRWYGFWDYGDFMHSYDPVRHTWRYDIGGCAWQNSELVPNMWLWFMFLRSGRADIFRIAEAMTRHTSEVDLYHFGEYGGLGSRHNVVHWGCGCKEARISMAGLHRYYYYLTADERLGDIMDGVKDSDYTTVNLDPMRFYYPKDEFPTHTRVGPDWSAFSSNWMTRWERFEDEAYRDKIIAGMDCIKAMPFRLLTGPVFGYDPKTGVLQHMGDDNWDRHLAICMGAPQIWFELALSIKDPEWEDILAEFGAFYNLPVEVKAARTGDAIKDQSWSWPMFSTAMVAFAAKRNQDKPLAQLAWSILLENRIGRGGLKLDRAKVSGYTRELTEIPWISTNEVAQWSLNTIVCLELIKDSLPGLKEPEAVKA